MNVLTRDEVDAEFAPRLKQSNEQADEETFLGRFDNVQLFLDDQNEDQKELDVSCGANVFGVLYVSTRRVFWIGGMKSEATGSESRRVGVAWDMRTIALHAISRDLDAFPKPCIYCQLDLQDGISELRLVPKESLQLEAIYKTLSTCAELNPDEDEDDELDQDDEDDEWIYNEEEVDNGAQQARLLAQLDSMLHVSPEFAQPEAGQFDDADDDQEQDQLL